MARERPVVYQINAEDPESSFRASFIFISSTKAKDASREREKYKNKGCITFVWGPPDEEPTDILATLFLYRFRGDSTTAKKVILGKELDRFLRVVAGQPGLEIQRAQEEPLLDNKAPSPCRGEESLPPHKHHGEILEGWKEIANHARCSVATARRHYKNLVRYSTRGKVITTTKELDDFRLNRSTKKKIRK